MKTYQLEDLLYLMSRLREPEYGCPWDLKQDYLSILPSTIEEAYEVADAIEKQDYAHLKEELGDLLFQVVFYSQLGQEDGHFKFADIVQSITEKLLRRHPHVFPDGTLESKIQNDDRDTEEKIKASWEAIKTQERRAKGNQGILDDVPLPLPALTRAAKLQKRAAQVGFDWHAVQEVLGKLDEEIQEFKEALESNDKASMKDELGDIFFSCVNIARHLALEPEPIVRHANNKFEKRFRKMEEIALQRDVKLVDLSEKDLDDLWQSAKGAE